MADISQLFLQVKLVYFDDNAIGFIGQALPLFQPGVVEVLNLLNTAKPPVIGVYFKTEGLEILQRFPVASGGCLTLSVTEHVDKDIQRAAGSYAGVKLAYRASSGIPGVSKQG